MSRRTTSLARVAASFAVVLLVLSGCSGEGGSGAGDAASPEDVLEAEATKGPVTVRLSVKPKSPTLSDEIEVAVTIVRETGVQVKQPPVRIALGEFVIRDIRRALPDVQDGKEVVTTRYRLEPQRSGVHLIRPIVVDFTVPEDANSEGAGKRFTVRTEPLRVEVGTTLEDAVPSLADVRGARDPVAVAKPRSPVPWTWLVIICAVVLAAASVAWYVAHRRVRAPLERRYTPEERAYQEMHALIQADYVSKEEYGAFYVELTGIVRRFIERTTEVHAPELTTEEFLREMKSKNLFAAEQQARLGSFLEAADLIKFAAQVPSANDIERSFDTAKAFVGLSRTEAAA